jgi:ribosomal protein S18 acetylase RimI-like enzyme
LGIRKFDFEKDLLQVLDLWALCKLGGAESNSKNIIMKKLQKDPELFLVYENAGDKKIIGTVVGGYDGWRGWIYRLGVHPDFRRKGIASKLLAEVIRRLYAKGARRIRANIVKGNEPSVRTFHKAGFSTEEMVEARLNLK